MDSPRRLLVDALTTALPAPFYVSDRVSAPDQVDPGKFNVRVLTADVTPGPTQYSLIIALEVWVVTASQDPATVDDQLDAALEPMLTALLNLPWVSFQKAARDVMTDADAAGWHGYLFTVHCFAQIEESP